MAAGAGKRRHPLRQAHERQTSTYGGVACSDRVSQSNMMTFRFSFYYAVELVVGHLRSHRWWRAEKRSGEGGGDKCGE
jgi:hypothetical protein